MQTHRDLPDHAMQDLAEEELIRRAKAMTAARENTITAGDVAEKPLARTIATAGGTSVDIVRLPKDTALPVRASVGGTGDRLYLSFRGDPDLVVSALLKAARALQGKVLSQEVGR